MAKSPIDKLLFKHPHLTHSTDVKVISHIQRAKNDWLINTIMIENVTVAFKFKRKNRYMDLTGSLVNLTYYPTIETVAGFDIEIMKVVRIKKA
ncbi:MAG: hypothetical protein HRU24_10190 [Gammaproteobacteria bacterium]|nr:hypothetical protein [Gammaproteobacteria bacterium]